MTDQPRNLQPSLDAFDHDLVFGLLLFIPDYNARERTYTAMRFQYNPETLTRIRLGEWTSDRVRGGGKVLDKALTPQEKSLLSGHRGGGLYAKSETIGFKLVFDAAELNKSASFPRISPDGRFLVITVSDYGTFPIWHREADLYLLDLHTGEYERMEVNSDEADSFHSWSSNGRWLVFSSRRLDGRTTRPYFAHMGPLGDQGKEFVLPQKDPSLYDRMLESFNVPELVSGKIELDSRAFVEAAKQEILEARAGKPPDSLPQPSQSG